MKTLIKKTGNITLLRVELIIDIICTVIAMLAIPVTMLLLDPALLLEPFILGLSIAVFVLAGLIGFLVFVRPLVLYKKLPEVFAEADEEFLYVHGKNEAKIPLSSLRDATVEVHLPFLFQKSFISMIIINLFSEQYGEITLEVPEYGTYKMRFVAYANETAQKVADFIYEQSK